jgi:hypothetical protein
VTKDHQKLRRAIVVHYTRSKLEDDAFPEWRKNFDYRTHALSGSDAGDTARPSASEKDATPIIRHGRTRSLRPVLIPPSFPSSRLLYSPSCPSLRHHPQVIKNTETDPSSSSTTTVTLNRTTGRKTRGRRFCGCPWRVSVRYMHMPRSLSACRGGRSSCFVSTRK